MAASGLVIEDLTKVFRGGRGRAVRAVDGVSLSAHPGEIVGLLGANGAGKTTTLKCASTLVIPTSGRILVDGVDAISSPRRAVRKIAAVLEGTRNIYWRLTSKENLQFFAELQGIPVRRVRVKIDALLERFGLGDKRDTPARMLSKGMQQKLALACALVKDTPVLLLDEPTLGLDPRASHDFRLLVRELSRQDGRTIVFSSHDMAAVESVCDRVIIVDRGRVVTDESVSNLVDLFRVRAYTFTVVGQLDVGQRNALYRLVPDLKLTDEDEHVVLDVEFPNPSSFYEVLDVLRQRECVVESIERRDPNLEQIFLRIVDKSGRSS